MYRSVGWCVLPMKAKDELVLKDWLYVFVIPADFNHLLEDSIPLELLKKVLYFKLSFIYNYRPAYNTGFVQFALSAFCYNLNICARAN